jgi:hypothetical protein
MDAENYIPRGVENYAFDESLTGRHMVFLAGPRQVGKTRLAKHWLKKKKCMPLYFNWDDVATRRCVDGRVIRRLSTKAVASYPWRSAASP